MHLAAKKEHYRPILLSYMTFVQVNDPKGHVQFLLDNLCCLVKYFV